MSDPLRKVQSGQPLAIPASAYNAFIDAAVDYRQRTAHIGGGSRPSRRPALSWCGTIPAATGNGSMCWAWTLR